MRALAISAYQVGVVCALPKEMAAVMAMLDEEHAPLEAKDPNDNNNYLLGRIHDHNVVVACLPAGVYGTNAAATVAKDMLRTFRNVRVGLMVGTGGGIPSLPGNDIRLGDVVVSQPDKDFGGVVQYDLIKYLGADRMERKGFLDKPPTALLTALSTLQTRNLLYDSKIPSYLQEALQKHSNLKSHGYGFPGSDKDRLHCSHCSVRERWWERLWLFLLWFLTLWRCNICIDGFVARKIRDNMNPVLHYGTIASGNHLLKDSTLRDQLGLTYGAKCVEMEAAGLMDNFRCIVIRGICDYADRYKNDEWQEYAALTAAAFAKELLSHVLPERVKEETPLREIAGIFKEQLDVTKELLQETKEQNQNLKTRYEDELFQKCHQVFKTTAYETFKNNVPERVSGTCQWVVNNSIFCRWYDSTNNDLLWVSADPGCGKSVLAKSLIDNELQSDGNRKVCYFFFKDNEIQNNLAAALNAILHQLFDQDLELISHAIPAWQSNDKMLNNELDKLWQIFIAAATDPRASSVFCVLDALDECKTVDQMTLIDLLNDFYQKTSATSFRIGNIQQSRLKFLVTSRPYDNIQTRFHLPPHLPSIRLRGEDKNEQIHEEINMVIKIHVDELATRLNLKQQTRHHIETQLLQMEHRTYLWLYLAIQSIYETYRDSLRPEQELIERLPSTVDDAYEKILSRVKPEKQDIVKLIFQIIIGAKRPLTVKEMAIALGIGTRPDATRLQEASLDSSHIRLQISQLCGLFVFISDSRVHLIHQTAKEFLTRSSEIAPVHVGWKYCLQPAEIELVMSRICIDLLFLEDVREVVEPLIDRMDSIDFTTPKLDWLTDQLDETGRFVLYAAVNWADHVRDLFESLEEPLMAKIMRLYDTTNAMFSWWYPIFAVSVYPLGEPPRTSRLCLAAWNGHYELVEIFLREGMSSDDVSSQQKGEALIWASRFSHRKIVHLLLGKGANVNARASEDDVTSLHVASGSGHLAVVKLLLDRGADVNAPERTHGRALSFASWNGHLAIVELLLDKGADINAGGGIFFSTALQAASAGGHLSTVQLLLDKGADVNFKGRGNDTAIQIASERGQLDIVELLLDKGADVNIKGETYGTALQAASRSGNLTIVQLLLDSGAEINAEGIHGTALFAASLNGQLDTVNLLLDRGADINAIARSYGTSLQAASLEGRLSVVRLILDKGANVNAEGIHGTALQAASSSGHQKVVKLLRNRGAIDKISSIDNIEEDDNISSFDDSSENGGDVNDASDGGDITELMVKKQE